MEPAPAVGEPDPAGDADRKSDREALGNKDIVKQCKSDPAKRQNCSKSFLFSAEDQEFWISNDWSEPVYCFSCRQARRKERDVKYSNKASTNPKVVQEFSYRRRLIVPAIVEAVLPSGSIMMTTGQGKEHTMMPSEMTKHLEPGMVVGVSLSASSGSITHVESWERESERESKLPLLKAFVQQVKPTSKTVVLKIRSRRETIEVLVQCLNFLPPAYSTVLCTPDLQDDLVSLSDVVRVLAPPAISKPTKFEVIAPSSAEALANILDVNADLSSPMSLSPFRYATHTPKDSYLRTEEDLIIFNHQRPEKKLKDLQAQLEGGLKPLILVDEYSAANLVPLLERWCHEIDSRGSVRTIKVLYPIKCSTTIYNMRNTIVSKLLDSCHFPLTSIQLLSNPLHLLPIDEGCNVTGKIPALCGLDIPNRSTKNNQTNSNGPRVS